MLRILSLTAVVLALGGIDLGQARCQPRLAAMALPSRRANSPVDRARRLGVLLAPALGATLVDHGKPLDLSASLGRAHSLFESGALDEAAAAFDRVLESGAATPHRLMDPSSFVTAHVTRAAIALVRGENERLVALLERILRYDPMATLLLAESRPPLVAVLEKIKQRLGSRPSITRQDLGEACQAADMLLVARSLAEDNLEVLLLKNCEPWREIRVSALASDEEVRSQLLGKATDGERPPRAGLRVAAGVVLGFSAAGLVTAAALLGSIPSDPELIELCRSDACAGLDAFEKREQAGWAMLGISAGLALVDVSLWITDATRRRKRAK